MVWGQVKMDLNTCGSGWGWIQTVQGRVGMGLKSCPRTELYYKHYEGNLENEGR